MLTIQELNEKKVPIIRINKNLNVLESQVLFPKKLKQANETLQLVGLPTASKSRNK